MKPHLLVAISLIIGTSCSRPTLQTNELKPTQPPKLGNYHKIENTSNQLATSSDSFYPHTTITVNDIIYTIAVDESQKIIYIETRDPKFKTPESLSIGCNIDQVEKAGGKPPLDEFGWAYHSLLPSGWHADFGSSLFKSFKQTPSSELKVYRFFTRKQSSQPNPSLNRTQPAPPTSMPHRFESIPPLTAQPPVGPVSCFR